MPSIVDWNRLLAELTDDELVRYAEIAGDQVRRECGRKWLQVLLAVMAVGVLCWTVWLVSVEGYSRTVLLSLGLSAALGYWPYRKIKTRGLWLSHCRAVEEEQKRRKRAIA